MARFSVYQSCQSLIGKGLESGDWFNILLLLASLGLLLVLLAEGMLAVPHWQDDFSSSSWASLPRMSLRFQTLYMSFASAPSIVSWSLLASYTKFFFRIGCYI
jgi:hypothetical protein